jgi:hypothetical protein
MAVNSEYRNVRSNNAYMHDFVDDSYYGEKIPVCPKCGKMTTIIEKELGGISTKSMVHVEKTKCCDVVWRCGR